MKESKKPSLGKRLGNKAFPTAIIVCVLLSSGAIGLVGYLAGNQISALEEKKMADMVNIQATALVGYEKSLNRQDGNPEEATSSQSMSEDGDKSNQEEPKEGVSELTEAEKQRLFEEVQKQDNFDPSGGAEVVFVDQNGNPTNMKTFSFVSGEPYSEKAYVIQWGDSLGVLGEAFGYTVRHLAEFNHIENPEVIYAGDLLYLPDTPPQRGLNVWL